MSIKFYNTLTGSIDQFSPIDPENVRMYVCGPTVYDTPHIGNARPIVIFDCLFRLLKRCYNNVTYVRNITDIDDKINNKAAEFGISINDLTKVVIKEFNSLIKNLNVIDPTYQPLATKHINQIIDIIEKLIETGYAYYSDRHVLYSVRKFQQYGLLSKRNIDDMISGSRVEIACYKKDPLDFVLWKPSDDKTPGWPSPFGNGRPGWHIECSAMSSQYLGKTFDIHAGGADLIFPHHENEIAQNYGAHGCIPANYWLHNSMILVNGQKMSKSLGNVIKLEDVLQKYDGQIIRYFLLSAHYQKPLDWNEDGLISAKHAIDRLYGALNLLQDYENSNCISQKLDTYDALSQNLNTPAALRALHEIADKVYKTSGKEQQKWAQKLKLEGEFLGFFSINPFSWFKSKNIDNISTSDIEELIAKRDIAKQQKNYELADEIRKKLFDLGVSLQDQKDGKTDWRHI